jgi:perosamine synthetase
MILEEDIEAVSRVLRSNYVGCGVEVKRLEGVFRDHFGRKYAIAVNSGSAALMLCLRSLSLMPGKKVITSGYVCSAVSNVIVSNGYGPKFIDVLWNNVNGDFEGLRRHEIGPDVGAIIVPHLGGYAAAIPEWLNDVAPVIEDCAASIGASNRLGEVGTQGVLSIFSFGSTKMITGGSGGMILTDSDVYYERISGLMAYDDPGQVDRACGCNLFMNDLQAALICSQFSRLNAVVTTRRGIAASYQAILDRSAGCSAVITADGAPSFYRFVFFSCDKSHTLARLRGNGVDARGSIAHNMSQCFELGSVGAKGITELEERLISIPIYPSMAKQEHEYILKALEEAVL